MAENMLITDADAGERISEHTRRVFMALYKGSGERGDAPHLPTGRFVVESPENGCRITYRASVKAGGVWFHAYFKQTLPTPLQVTEQEIGALMTGGLLSQVSADRREATEIPEPYKGTWAKTLSLRSTSCGPAERPVAKWMRWFYGTPQIAIGAKTVKAWWLCRGCGYHSEAEFYDGVAVRLECGFCKHVTKTAHGTN